MYRGLFSLVNNYANAGKQKKQTTTTTTAHQDWGGWFELLSFFVLRFFSILYIFFTWGSPRRDEMRDEMRCGHFCFVIFFFFFFSVAFKYNNKTLWCQVHFFLFCYFKFSFWILCKPPPPPTPPPLPLSRNSYNAWCVIIRKRQINKRHFRMILVE